MTDTDKSEAQRRKNAERQARHRQKVKDALWRAEYQERDLETEATLRAAERLAALILAKGDLATLTRTEKYALLVGLVEELDDDVTATHCPVAGGPETTYLLWGGVVRPDGVEFRLLEQQHG